MLELEKKQIQMSKSKGSVLSQIIFDEDFIIPDAKRDAGSILLKQADAVLEELVQMQEKVAVKGKLCFEILYTAENSRRMQNLVGSIDFEEAVPYPGLEARDHVKCRTKVEDISIRIVNSRKLHISAVLGLELMAAAGYREEAAIALHCDKNVAVRGNDLEMVSLQLQKKDTFRMEEDIFLPSGKPPARTILWRSFCLSGMEYHIEPGALQIQAEILVFVIYEAEQEQMPMQWLEKTVSCSATLPLTGAQPEMIPAIEAVLIRRELEIRPDEDGENRILHMDAVAELDMKLYQEEKVHVLCDAYSTSHELVAKSKEAHLEKLLMKNRAKCKITEKIPIHPTDTMLQICHSQGRISIDRAEIVKEGIRIEGALYVTVLYLAANDERPMQSASSVVPVSHVIEAGGIEPGSYFDICPMLEQVSTMIAPGGEGEVRAVVSFDTLVLSQHEISVLESVEEAKEEMPKDLPGMIGYIVQSGDSLWSIAKKYRMAMDRIREVNQLKSDQLHQGEKLLLIRK